MVVIMTKDEALRLALEALEYLATQIKPDYEHSKAITAIKAALEAKDEPVAWRTYAGRGYYIIDKTLEEAEQNWPDRPHSPLYTTSPQRTWIGLTDEQFLLACQMAEGGNYMVAFQRIQQWLKENNT
jgi:hypothetical protein